ncbi:MAG: ABC transporter permease [Lachnospiraceae bacterium]|nr:ABC transporter permease [Lachnospiraceae bacterium]MDD3797020.1 ABC transporter permease [Lachnospiraceae bacterium]
MDFMTIIGNVFTYSLVHDMITASVPIILACMCAVISRQVNIINIAAEGIIMFGCFFGVLVSYMTGSWVLAVLVSVGLGMLISAFMALAYLKYNVNIFVLGLCVNMIGTSGTRFLLQTIFKTSGNFVSDKIVPIPRVNFSFLDNIPVLKSLFSGYSFTEWLVIPIVIFIWFMLYKSVWGLRLRSVGLNEMAAVTSGIDVNGKKLAALVLSGACAGLAGAHLSLGYSCLFIENMSGGRGFMGMAAMQFGGANPLWAAIGCVVFGFSNSVANRLTPYGIPNQFVTMIPYVATIIVLSASVVLAMIKRRKSESALKA